MNTKRKVIYILVYIMFMIVISAKVERSSPNIVETTFDESDMSYEFLPAIDTGNSKIETLVYQESGFAN